MLTRDEIIWGYRYVLGHEPDEHAIEVHRVHADVATFRRILLECSEFRSLGIGPYAETRWVLAPGPSPQDRIWVDVADRMIGYDVIHGVFEPRLTRAFRALVGAGHTVLDVGANVGWYTLAAARGVGEGGRVVAVEPNPDIAVRLRASVEANGFEARVAVVVEALGDAPGRATLGRPRQVANYGNAFLVETPDAALFECHDVAVGRLDDMPFPRLDLVKIDCEGAEALVLGGGLRTIGTHRPLVVSEVFDAQLRLVSRCTAADYLARYGELGYVAYLVEDDLPVEPLAGWRDFGGRDHVNVVFVPREREPDIATRLRSTA